MSLPAAPLVPGANNPQGVGHDDTTVGGSLSVAGSVAVGTASTMGTTSTPVVITDGGLETQFQMIGNKAFIRVITTSAFSLPNKFVFINPDPTLGPNVSMVISPVFTAAEVNRNLTTFQYDLSATQSNVIGNLQANPAPAVPPAVRDATNVLYQVLCV